MYRFCPGCDDLNLGTRSYESYNTESVEMWSTILLEPTRSVWMNKDNFIIRDHRALTDLLRNNCPFRHYLEK